ncbi:hypothetical protein OGW15_12455 [Citrobacter sp. Cf039]|uniref:hypothetical protein n=1 Tax=Citrobacter TaxID=544 RepID=UPI0025769093|nr:hypothetical protein [Citrobacter sp. Cf039]MDM3265707.1 hypothetical protein [Citrobacter sp. Cf039]MEB0898188.1 hypothetical protein [Citrobacter freundii]
MTSREKFEAWYLENWGHTEDDHETLFERDPGSNEEYYRLGVRMAHGAWQASESASQQKLTDMAVQLANAESKCRELAAGNWPRLQEQDINALMRFNETCEDGEGYDIRAEAMARLVEIGLASKGPHGIRNITPFGQWVINAREGELDLEPLKTEEDNIAESALRMAQLRTGAAQ